MADPEPVVAAPQSETAEQVVEGLLGQIEPILAYIRETSARLA
jgi:hypothetical protein